MNKAFGENEDISMIGSGHLSSLPMLHALPEQSKLRNI